MAAFSSDFASRRDGTLLVKITGRLDGNSAPAFGRELAPRLHPLPAGVLFDASGLEFISSAGLRELMTLVRTLNQHKAKAVLIGVSPFVNETLKISGMHSLFLHAENEEKALRLISGKSGFSRKLFSGGTKV